jgi:uncharacterized protein
MNQRRKLAIVGSGIAGMTCAHYLKDAFDLSIFEKNPESGGHTNTRSIRVGGCDVNVDTGFMVFNRKTYPGLLRLFGELNIESYSTSMSFSVRNDPGRMEYSGNGLGGFFGQRARLADPGHYRMLYDIFRLERCATDWMQTQREGNVADFLKESGFSRRFAEQFFLPMAGAIWSTAAGDVRLFHAGTILRFFANHGLLRPSGHLEWMTVKGGSRVYRDRILDPLRSRLHVNRAVQSIRRGEGSAVVTDVHGVSERFDAVILAAHADEALAMLEGPTKEEADLLSKFRYNCNPTQLHTWTGMMPKRRRIWASWNFRYHDDGAQSTTYWMNHLQALGTDQPVFVTLNDPGLIPADQVLWKTVYHHPKLDASTATAQTFLPRLNRSGPVYFAGSYFRNGFHEDALQSGLDVCRILLGEGACP